MIKLSAPADTPKNRHMTLKIHKVTHHKPRTPHTHHNTGPAQDRTSTSVQIANMYRTGQNFELPYSLDKRLAAALLPVPDFGSPKYKSNNGNRCEA